MAPQKSCFGAHADTESLKVEADVLSNIQNHLVTYLVTQLSYEVRNKKQQIVYLYCI